MIVKLLCIGKTHSNYIQTGVDEYISRINRYVKFEMTCLPDIKNVASLSAEQRKTEEGKLILANTSNAAIIILLDEGGKAYSSEQLADQWQNWLNRGAKEMIFVVGGPYGFSKEVYARAHEKLSLSPLTFSHEMVRLFFVEQVYRVNTIIKKEPYHHR